MHGLNITITSYNLPSEYKKANETSICIETIPEGNLSLVSFPTSQVTNSSSFFSINVQTLAEQDNKLFQNYTKKIVITISSKFKIRSDEIIAVGYIYPEDFPSNLGDQNSLLVDLYRPAKGQSKRKKAKSLGSSPDFGAMELKESQKKIIGSLKVQLTLTQPYHELNQNASWSVNHRSRTPHKPLKAESSNKDLVKPKHRIISRNRENEIYNQIF